MVFVRLKAVLSSLLQTSSFAFGSCEHRLLCVPGVKLLRYALNRRAIRKGAYQ